MVKHPFLRQCSLLLRPPLSWTGATWGCLGINPSPLGLLLPLNLSPTVLWLRARTDAYRGSETAKPRGREDKPKAPTRLRARGPRGLRSSWMAGKAGKGAGARVSARRGSWVRTLKARVVVP